MRNKPQKITESLLKSWPLPEADRAGDKDGRGRVLVVAGNRGLPGAAVLCATAALRAGAGKLRMAAPVSLVDLLSSLVPEAFVTGLAEHRAGVVHARSAQQLVSQLEQIDALVIGPGMESDPAGESAVAEIVGQTLVHLNKKTLVLDAVAMNSFTRAMSKRTNSSKREPAKQNSGKQKSGKQTSVQRKTGDKQFTRVPADAKVIITPHAGEMAHLTGLTKEEIVADPVPVARDFAKVTGVTVVLKGSTTIIATPGGDLYRNTRGNAGLGTSGSGDVLAGIIVGLAARGATPEQAAAWGVFAHAVAGEILAREIGPVGYLARELSACVPQVLSLE